MCGTAQPRGQRQIVDRGSNPGSDSQSVLMFFFLLGPHALPRFFLLLTFTILRGLLHLMKF